jgi:ribosomal protein L11 methyltransferase
MACGSGTHPTTQLCLEALEQYVWEGQPALDVGTGSGILAHAARLLGADPVLACDIEHEASVVAQRNFAETPFRIPVFTGSLRSVRSHAVKMVVANLNAATLQTLATELKRVVSHDGMIVVSGFRDAEVERVRSFFDLPARERRSKEDYACLVL